MTSLAITDLEAQDWIVAAIIAASTIALAAIVRRLTKRRVRRKDHQAELIDLSGRLLVSVIVAVGAFYTLRALEVEIGPLLGAFGVGALFIAVGLQTILTNLVSSVILQARRPFIRGDQISASGYEGTVIDVTATSTVLLAYNGERVHVPNSDLLTEPLINWTHEPIRRSVLPLSIPYDCELPLVLATLGRSARRALDDDNLPPAEAMVTGFGDHGILVEMRFWHYSDEIETRVATSQVAVAIVEGLRAIDVSIPYPQVVMHRAANVDASSGDADRSA